MNYDVVVTCAVTGAGDTTGKSPHVPVTPKEVADAAIEAAKAGAAISFNWFGHGLSISEDGNTILFQEGWNGEKKYLVYEYDGQNWNPKRRDCVEHKHHLHLSTKPKINECTVLIFI